MTGLVSWPRWVPGGTIALAMLAAAAALPQAAAAQSAALPLMAHEFPPGQIFTMLFLMLGPFKIIGPFAKLTSGADDRQARRIAGLATVFASAALVVAALLGKTILDSYGIPVSVMALTGGVVLFLVALRNLLEQFEPHEEVASHQPSPAAMKVALAPLAFPTIVTPHGIAAVVVMMALSPDVHTQLIVGGIIVVIMLVNLVTMVVARRILPVMGIALPILGAVLGVVQVALGLEISHNALIAMGVL